MQTTAISEPVKGRATSCQMLHLR